MTDTKWRKGQSGNPGGRKKIPADIQEAFRAYTHEAITVAVAIMRNPRAKNSDRLAAVNSILDRGWGKPRQQIEGTGGDGEITVVIRKLTDPSEAGG